LHQLIKDTFKDHLVDWIEEYLMSTNTKREANRILSIIDQWCMVLSQMLNVNNYLHPGLLLFPLLLGFEDFLKVMISNSGLEMIQKH
jgi:hypothetical protein